MANQNAIHFNQTIGAKSIQVINCFRKLLLFLGSNDDNNTQMCGHCGLNPV